MKDSIFPEALTKFLSLAAKEVGRQESSKKTKDNDNWFMPVVLKVGEFDVCYVTSIR